MQKKLELNKINGIQVVHLYKYIFLSSLHEYGDTSRKKKLTLIKEIVLIDGRQEIMTNGLHQSK
jgi:hypothetical protein